MGELSILHFFPNMWQYMYIDLKMNLNSFDVEIFKGEWCMPESTQNLFF